MSFKQIMQIHFRFPSKSMQIHFMHSILLLSIHWQTQCETPIFHSNLVSRKQELRSVRNLHHRIALLEASKTSYNVDVLDKGFRSYRVPKSQNFDPGFGQPTGPLPPTTNPVGESGSVPAPGAMMTSDTIVSTSTSSAPCQLLC